MVDDTDKISAQGGAASATLGTIVVDCNQAKAEADALMSDTMALFSRSVFSAIGATCEPRRISDRPACPSVFRRKDQ